MHVYVHACTVQCECNQAYTLLASMPIIKRWQFAVVRKIFASLSWQSGRFLIVSDFDLSNSALVVVLVRYIVFYWSFLHDMLLVRYAHSPLNGTKNRSRVVIRGCASFKIRGRGWPLKQPEIKIGSQNANLEGHYLLRNSPKLKKRGHEWPPKAAKNPKLGVIFAKCAPMTQSSKRGGHEWPQKLPKIQNWG